MTYYRLHDDYSEPEDLLDPANQWSEPWDDGDSDEGALLVHPTEISAVREVSEGELDHARGVFEAG